MLLSSVKRLRPSLRRLWRSHVTVFCRNTLKIKPTYFRYPSVSASYSASDMFVWRTDKNMKTIFRVSDISHTYFGVASNLLLNVFDEKGRMIREEILPLDGSLKEFEITKEYVGTESIGTFCAYHMPIEKIDDRVAITNRCYVGYSFGDSIPSFVHGNILSKMFLIDGPQEGNIQSALYKHRVNSEYHIQKQFGKFDRSELILVNPLDRVARVSINGEKKELGAGHVCAFDVLNAIDKVVIDSDMLMPRPIVFSYKGPFFDVHHG